VAGRIDRLTYSVAQGHLRGLEYELGHHEFSVLDKDGNQQFVVDDEGKRKLKVCACACA
jgi:hypothetical protein